MAISWDSFDKIWASTSPLTPYSFSDPNYAQGWNFVGSTPPARQMWDSIQKQNDEKFKYLRDNFGTPNIVTQASQMTDTDKVYVYLGSEAGWNNGHWYYYDEGTSSWADGGVYNSVAFVTDTTLSIAGQPADAKATGDALALKSDLAGCTFTGNVSVNADLSVTGDATIGTDLSVTGVSTLTGNVSAGADVTVVGDVSSANLTTSADASVGGDLTVTGDSTLADASVNDLVVNNDLSVAGDSSLTNLSVSGTTALAGTSTAPTPSADDNSTKIATTEYVQTEIKPIEVNADIVNKRVTNIEKLLEGNLYDYQTDTDSKYTKTVLAGAMPYASLDSVGGKTVVWNQLVVMSNGTSVKNGITYTITSDGTVVINGTATAIADSAPTSFSSDLTIGHVYWLRGCPADSSASTYFLNTNNGQCYADGLRFTANSSTSRVIHVRVESGVTANNVTFKVQCTDLTLVFGAGNEPTLEECRTMFPAESYPYNAGTLLSAGVTEVVPQGKNLFDSVVFEQGSFNLSTGDYATSTTRLRTHGYINVLPNTTYNISVGTSSPQQQAFTLFEYKADETYIGYSSINSTNTTITTGATTGKIRVTFRYTNDSTIVASDLQNPLLVKPIANYPIPAEVRALEGYGWSAGTVYNYVDFERKVFVQRVASVDLGSLAWNKANSGGVVYRYSQTLSDVIKPTEINDVGNIVSQQYIAGSYHNAYDGAFNCIGIGRPTVNVPYRVAIYDSTKEEMTNAEFKESVSGVYAYYELATPQETDISQYLTDDNLISVESGGTLTFPNSNGDDYRIPVPSAETYMVDLQSALGE